MRETEGDAPPLSFKFVFQIFCGASDFDSTPITALEVFGQTAHGKQSHGRKINRAPAFPRVAPTACSHQRLQHKTIHLEKRKMADAIGSAVHDVRQVSRTGPDGMYRRGGPQLDRLEPGAVRATSNQSDAL